MSHWPLALLAGDPTCTDHASNREKPFLRLCARDLGFAAPRPIHDSPAAEQRPSNHEGHGVNRPGFAGDSVN
jgi:hypothetical protein